MGIVSVERKYAGLSGKGTLAGERNYRMVFVVITNNPDDGVMVVGNASGIPHKGDVYFTATDIDPGALCQDVSPKQDQDEQTVWEVVCTYSSHSGDPAKDDNNPMVHPPDIHWGSWGETRALYQDFNDKKFVNSAGQPLDPPVERRFKYPALTVVRNEATFPVMLVQSYWDRLNSDVFNGWPPGTVKVEDIRAASQYREAQGFFRVTYEFLFRNEGWKHYEIDHGTYHLEENDSGDKEKTANKCKGIATTNDMPLDGNGDLLTQAEIDAGNFVVNEWVLFERKPFSIFGF